MPKIFISYRREDSQSASDRLYDKLVGHFGPEDIFYDVDSIPEAGTLSITWMNRSPNTICCWR